MSNQTKVYRHGKREGEGRKYYTRGNHKLYKKGKQKTVEAVRGGG